MRLTTHDKGRQPYVITANERTWREIYDKLAAYEDTGIEPEEIEDRQDVCLWIPEDRFAEIINAEADGRLVVFPCKVGDTLYAPTRNIISEFRVSQFDFGGYEKSYLWVNWYLIRGITGNFRIDGIKASEIGKTVFLTRAEAESALKGEREDV